MHEKQYIIVTYGWNGTEYLSDLWTKDMGDVVVLQSAWRDVHSRLLKIVRKVHLSRKVNRIVRLPWKKIWYAFEDIDWKTDVQYCVIFAGVWGKDMDTAYLAELQSRFHISYVLLVLDSMQSPVSFNAKEYIRDLDLAHILTFDPTDAELYHFVPVNEIYSYHPCRVSPAGGLISISAAMKMGA